MYACVWCEHVHMYVCGMNMNMWYEHVTVWCERVCVNKCMWCEHVGMCVCEVPNPEPAHQRPLCAVLSSPFLRV